ETLPPATGPRNPSQTYIQALAPNLSEPLVQRRVRWISGRSTRRPLRAAMSWAHPVSSGQNSEPERLPVFGVLAIARLEKHARRRLLSAERAPSSPRSHSEACVSFFEIARDRLFGILNAGIVAVVDDGPCHSTKHRLDDVEELSPAGEW